MSLSQGAVGSTLAAVLAVSLAACGGSAKGTGEDPIKVTEQAADAQAADMAQAGQLTGVEAESMVENAAATAEAEEEQHAAGEHAGSGAAHQ